jgi:hypothetical protein
LKTFLSTQKKEKREKKRKRKKPSQLAEIGAGNLFRVSGRHQKQNQNQTKQSHEI